MAKVLIPTPLRQFTGKQDAVTVAGATVGEVLSALTAQYPDLRKQIFNDEGKVRSFVNVYLNDEDIRYLSKDATAGQGRRHHFAGALHRRRLDAWPRRPKRRRSRNDEILRYSRHLIIPEVGIEGQQKLKAAKVLLVGAGGLGAPLGLYLAAAGRRPHRPGRFRRGRLHQPAAPGDPLHRRRGPQEARFGRREDAGHQSARRRSSSTRRRSPARTRSTSSRITTSWSTAPTISPRATW